ncbi:MAG: hypothetical protein ACI9HK_006265, partial [Pirellulaceae bacterium]
PVNLGQVAGFDDDIGVALIGHCHNNYLFDLRASRTVHVELVRIGSSLGSGIRQLLADVTIDVQNN